MGDYYKCLIVVDGLPNGGDYFWKGWLDEEVVAPGEEIYSICIGGWFEH